MNLPNNAMKCTENLLNLKIQFMLCARAASLHNSSGKLKLRTCIRLTRTSALGKSYSMMVLWVIHQTWTAISHSYHVGCLLKRGEPMDSKQLLIGNVFLRRTPWGKSYLLRKGERDWCVVIQEWNQWMQATATITIWKCDICDLDLQFSCGSKKVTTSLFSNQSFLLRRLESTTIPRYSIP